MRILFGLSFALLLASGCAKIPAGSVGLADALQTEGTRMHTLNLRLLNNLFAEKRASLESVLTDKYTASLINNFFDKTPTVSKEDLPELVQSFTRKVIVKRDSLVNVLETEKARLIDALNEDYNAFNTASIALKLMLESAVKVDKEKQALFEQVKTLSNNKLDFSRVENALDDFINSAGAKGGDVVKFKNEIDLLLKK